MKRVFSFFLFACFFTNLVAQKSLLQSGPMLGYSEMREVLLWVQTKEAADVQFTYWNLGKPSEKFATEAKKTQKQNGFTAKLIADEVLPGKTYGYTLKINDKAVKFDYPTTFQTQTLWDWRMDPPPFSMAFGSCAYINEAEYDRPGRPYGGEYQVFTSIHKKRPDAMLWLGDNMYLREVDWFTRTGILHRNTHTRSLPELQPLLASTHHYAIWDDHDFGPNDSDRSFIHKEVTLEAFKLFWGNPTFGVNGQKGVTTFFQFVDIDFFLLDNRYFRTPNNRKTGKKTIMGQQQLEWLIDALVYSRAPFKMVAIGGQVLNTEAKYETYANIAPEERAYLLQRIAEENIKGVIFVTGDRHHSELSKYVNNKGNTVYDVTVSPFSAGPASRVEDDNKLRVDSTLVTQRNFGIFEFSGPRLERKLLIKVFDVEGELLWDYEISSE